MERARAETARQEERDRLTSLINSISEEVWFADVREKLLWQILRPFGSSILI